MKFLLALVLIGICLVSSGCRTVSKDSSYTPYSDRPATAEDYWKDRAEQDRLADRQGAPAKAP